MLGVLIGFMIGAIIICLLYYKPLKGIFRKKETISPIPHEPPNIKYNILDRISKSPRYYQDDYIISQRITQKIRDLQDQLIRNRQSVDGFQLDIKDELRYEAMVEILKAMLDK